MISLITTLKNLKSYTLLIEIIDTESIEYYRKLGIPSDILMHLEKNLDKKKDSEKIMTFYGDFHGSEKISAYFPKKESLSDDRSETLRKAPKNTIFLPSTEFFMAYEVYTLATYSYDRFLTKKDEKSYALYVPSDEKKQIESQKPLLHAIIRARDIINLPPTDTRPEAFVEYIASFQWKNFKLRVIDAKELQKLGCNLLLAVGAGSDYPPYMVILERIIDKKLDTYALIGKGVTFDSGGLQIKPDTAMLDMKCDMS